MIDVAVNIRRKFVFALLLVSTALYGTVQPAEARRSPAQQYIRAARKACDNAERQLPQMTRVAEIVADRFIAGGLIGFPRLAWYQGQGLEEELWGRSGQIIHVSFDRPYKLERTETEKANDVLLMGWRKDPNPDDLELLKSFKAKHTYIIGFGPRRLPSLQEQIKLCDAWFDTGYTIDDRVVKLPDGTRAGHANLLSDAINAWCLMGEVVSACTRRGKMPTMAKAYSYADGEEWWNRYFQKQQFHNDYQVAPITHGALARAYLHCIRNLLTQYESTQPPAINKTVDLIVNELKQGRKTVVAAMGHMPWAYAGRDEATAWAIPLPTGLHYNLEGEVEYYNKQIPDEALVLRLGYSGQAHQDTEIFSKKKQRVMLIAGPNPRPEFQIPNDLLTYINMDFEFGDACVRIPNYPIRVLPPSGVMQIVAYETVNTEVLSRLKSR